MTPVRGEVGNQHSGDSLEAPTKALHECDLHLLTTRWGGVTVLCSRCRKRDLEKLVFSREQRTVYKRKLHVW